MQLNYLNFPLELDIISKLSLLVKKPASDKPTPK